jgi:2-keto-3-deoxy-L-rhamnonate aldolase RhmA
LKEKMRSGAIALGGWLSLPDLSVAEIMAGAGFDWLMIDGEHGAFDLGTLQQAFAGLRGTATVPLVRVPWNDAVRIKQVLDIGGEGIMLPQVNSAAEARAAVAACKYPPEGIRGFGPRRASDWGRNIDAYVAGANDELLVIPQIESVAAAKDIDAILDVPGIDAICLGPNDLSGSVGLLRQVEHPTVANAIDHVIARCKARGVPACTGITLPPDRALAWAARGATFIFAADDADLLASGAARALAAFSK